VGLRVGAVGAEVGFLVGLCELGDDVGLEYEADCTMRYSYNSTKSWEQ